MDSFSRVRGVKSKAKSLPTTMSEDQFKNGVKAIIGETGTFKDWGGESSDLFSTRLLLNGRRRRVAFGFKGPGSKTALVPARLGKNGDQIERLFSEPAAVFFVQHWREIRPSVIEQMNLRTRKPVWYVVMIQTDCASPIHRSSGPESEPKRTIAVRSDFPPPHSLGQR